MKDETKRKIADFLGINPMALLLTSTEKSFCRFLKKQELYDMIYFRFGLEAYNYYVPENKRRNDIEDKKKKQLESARDRLGEKEYNEFLIETLAIYMGETKGNVYATLWKSVYKLKNLIARKGLKATLYSMAMVLGVSASYTLSGHYYAEISEFVNGSRYESMIADSDEKIEKYVKNEFEGKDYTDIQVFIKVMLDMWRSIDGYQDPQLDIRGYLELDITQNGYGVCRNMASYVEKVLTAMGYNARAYAVYVDQNISENESENDSTDNQNFGERLISKYKEEVGNHEIVLVDIPEDNITLVVDPTDIDIGIYYQGEIYMFGLMEGEITDFRQAKHYSPSHYGQFSCLGEHLVDIYEEVKKSYREPAISIEGIVEKYGCAAIYAALELFVRQDALIKPLSQGFTQDEKNTDGGVDSSKNSIEKGDLEQDGSIL